jgi:hypothetical protein
MRFDHPNRPEQLTDLSGRDYHERDKYPRTGHAAQDGHTVCYRRPRVRGFNETIDLETADRIEGIFGGPLEDM